MRRVDERQALRLGDARLVVLDVAGDEHVGDLGHAAWRWPRRPSPGSTATRLTRRAPSPAVAHVGQAQDGRDVGGERRQRLRGRQHAETPEAERGDLVLDRVQVVGAAPRRDARPRRRR